MIKGFEQIDASSGVKTLTVPAGANKAIVQAETANVRLRLDGTNPTSSVGEILVANATRELHGDELTAAKFIAASGAPKINVHYYGPHFTS